MNFCTTLSYSSLGDICSNLYGQMNATRFGGNNDAIFSPCLLAYSILLLQCCANSDPTCGRDPSCSNHFCMLTTLCDQNSSTNCDYNRLGQNFLADAFEVHLDIQPFRCDRFCLAFLGCFSTSRSFICYDHIVTTRGGRNDATSLQWISEDEGHALLLMKFPSCST